MSKTKNQPAYIVSCPMGSGKTASVIANMKEDRNYLIAVPKIDLAESIAERIEDNTDLDVQEIHSSDGEYGPVKDRIEQALSEGREGSVVIVTHTSLLNIEPSYVAGWTVIVDEVPNIDNCRSKRMGYNNFKDSFGEYVIVGEDLMCSLESMYIMDIRERYAEAKRTDQEELVIMYGGLLSETSEVELEDHDGTWLIKSQGYKDFSKIIDHADEFHVMGNGVEKTLFYLFLQAKGYEIKESIFTPVFNGYDLPPTLVPMVKGDKFSKEIMLTKEDGSVSKTFDKECFGWSILKEALEYHKNERVIVQVFKWMKEAFPFKDYPNVEVTEFDVRGLNEYRDYHRTVNLIHGNPTPIQGRMQERMFEMMGVDPEKAREAVRHERHIEPMAQHILRTDMRNIGNQKAVTITVVPTVEVAEEIEEILQIKCKIDKSIMREPPKSKAKQAREELIKKAIELDMQGMSARAIAKELGKGNKTISNWLKEYKQAA